MSVKNSLTSRAYQRFFGLGTPETRDVNVERDIAVPVGDGVVLRADRWTPNPLPPGTPVMLFLTPYDRGGFQNALSRMVAERGFQVLVVSSRGGFGSTGGPFDPVTHDAEDGLAVLDWIREQDWYPGRIVLAGASYVGYTQWAVAARAGDDVVAMNPHVTTSSLARTTSGGGAPQADLVLRWGALLHAQENPVAFFRLLVGIGAGRVRRAMDAVPSVDGDRLAFGRPWPFLQNVLRRPVDDPRWDAGDFSGTVGDVTVPTSLYAGWYDIFISEQLRDFAAMRAAGREVRLTVGDFTHPALSGMAASLRDTLEFSRERAGLQPVAARPAVRLRVMGADTWRDFDSWPPAATPTTWYLQPGGGLSEAEPEADRGTSGYRYDPADPTPTVGGRLLLKGAGRADQRARESRDDVLVFTTGPLAADLDVIGEPSATIWAESDAPYFDLHVRLCEVDDRGRSFNVCDGIVSLRSRAEEQGPRPYTIELAPTAQRFARGHRIRVQVSSGSHPEYLRNAGTDPSRGTATELTPARITIHHDRSHPSGIHLPHLR